MSSNPIGGSDHEIVFRNVKGVSLVLGFWTICLIIFTWMLWPFLQSPRYLWAYMLAVPLLVPTVLYARSKVVVGDSQVIVINPFGSTRVPVESVVGVVAAKAPGWGMTGFLQLASGRAVRMFAFECGWGWACVEMEQKIERLNRIVESRKESKS